jgi:signal transduction histidine kinase
MGWLLYLRLIVLTAGTLLPFFWMVVILGHRRQRNFERVFFFLCLALTCFFGSSLLALNATLYYDVPPPGLMQFSWIFLCLGIWFVPPLVLHLHIEYAALRGLLRPGKSYLARLIAIYAPAILFSPRLMAALQLTAGRDFERPSHLLGPFFQVYLIASLALAAYWQSRFAFVAPDDAQKAFHAGLKWDFGILSLWMLGLFFFPPMGSTLYTQLAFLFVLAPFWKLLMGVGEFNFLQIGRQRNLIYAVFGVFVALLYLSLVRRAGLWLEPYLPPAASAALLLFLPVVFFEPLQRIMRRLLRQTAQSEVDRAQKLMGPINDAAGLYDQEELKKFCEQRIAEELQLAEVRILFDSSVGEEKAESPWEGFRIGRAGLREMRVRPFGAMVSGETHAALEMICDQLPAAFVLSRLIQEKLQLERELAERERMALVGQMAASISHNLKNPLGSIKTILQVQMESAELPEKLQQETRMVLEEINRLSARLNQLLQFSRPGVRAGAAKCCDLAQVTDTVANMLRHAAEERGISLQVAHANGEARAAIGEEAANDILSNVLLNAIEAAPVDGRVRVFLQTSEKVCTVSVEDDGPGISPADQEKVLRPFFTTKSRGTGLGLAIVDRRLQEAGGSLHIHSPAEGGHGTEIRLHFPVASREQTG